MRRWSPFFDALNGRNAFTPAGIAIVTLLWFGLAFLSGWGQARGDERGEHLLPLVLSHALFASVCLLVWWLLYYRAVTPPNQIVAWLLFMLLGAVRIALIDGAYWVTGVEPLGTLVLRVLLSVVITAQLFGLIGAVGELVDRSSRAEVELWRAEQSIRAMDEDKQRVAQFWRSDVLGTIEHKLNELFATWERKLPSDPGQVAGKLLGFVTEVVRPLSHAMNSFPNSKHFHAHELTAATTMPPSSIRVHWATLRVSGGLTMVVFSAPVFVVYTVARYGAGIEIALALMSLTLLGLGFQVTRRLVDALDSKATFGRLLVIAGSLLGVGIVATAVPVAVGQQFGSTVTFVWGEPILVFAVGAALSIGEHLVLEARQREQLRLEALERLAQDSARRELRDRDFAERAAENLHSGIQAELVAWAGVFSSHTFDSSEIPGTLREMRHRLDGLLTEDPMNDGGSPRGKIGDLIRVWSAARPVQAHIDDDVWVGLEDNPSQAETVLKILSEGFANAVRHGREGDIRLEISRSPVGQLELRISNPGSLPRSSSADGDGLGLRTIAARSTRTELTEDRGVVSLTVELDWGDGGDDGNRTRTISLED